MRIDFEKLKREVVHVILHNGAPRYVAVGEDLAVRLLHECQQNSVQIELDVSKGIRRVELYRQAAIRAEWTMTMVSAYGIPERPEAQRHP